MIYIIKSVKIIGKCFLTFPDFSLEDTRLDSRVAAVTMRGVTKTFGSVLANDKVDLDIYKGEILALLGENGSGKTTLMNMLSGIYFPDEGQIFINGKEAVISSPKVAFWPRNL